MKLNTKLLEHRGVRYLIAGTASEVIEYVSFLGLYAVTHKLYISNSASFILGVLSGFIFHKTWTFRGEHQFKTHYQFWSYVSLAGINFVLMNIMIGIYVDRFKLSPALSKLLAIATTVIWTYAITNIIIFRQKSKQPSDDQQS